MDNVYNLVIVGGGPAGLCAAINGASEMPGVLLIDSGKKDECSIRRSILGGQARGSTRIENYPGFPGGVSGAELIDRFVKQAALLGADMLCPERAERLELTDGGLKKVTTKEGHEFIAKAVILANGLSYRKLEAEGVADLLGKGVMYGSPTTNALDFGTCTVCIVGAANSAGQAALHFADNPKCTVRMLVRGDGLSSQMSKYLVDRIERQPNIEVLNGVSVRKVAGASKLECVTLAKKDGGTIDVRADHLFVYIGAVPKTGWLDNAVKMDNLKFIATGTSLGTLYGQKQRFETSMPGVFAAGDIRLGNRSKRVASAVGEGAGVISDVHQYLSPH